MAAANPLDYFDTTELDESAVSALVGSLETQLASPSHKDVTQSLSETSVNNNHINSASTPTVCSASFNIVQTTNVTPGLKGLSLPNSVTLNNTNSLTSKLTNSDSQIIGINSIINSTNVSSASNSPINSVHSATRIPNSTQVVRVSPTSQNMVNARNSPVPQISAISNNMTFTNHVPVASKSPQIDLNSTVHSPNANKVIVSKPGEPVSVLNTSDSNQKPVIIPQVVSGVPGIVNVVSQNFTSLHDPGLKPGQILVKQEHSNALGVNTKMEPMTSVKTDPLITSQASQFLLKPDQNTVRSPISNVKQEPVVHTIQQVPGTHVQTNQVAVTGNHITQATNVHIVNAPIKGQGNSTQSVITVRTPGQTQQGQVVMRPQIITTQAPQASSAPMQVVSVCGSNVGLKLTQSQSKVVQARMAAASPARNQQINIAPRPGATGTITISPGGMLPPGAMLMRNDQGTLMVVTNQAAMQQSVTTSLPSSTTGQRIQYVRPPTGTSQSQPRPPVTQIMTIQHPTAPTGQPTVLRQTVPSTAAQTLTTSVSSSTPQVVQTIRNSNPSIVQHAIGASQTSGTNQSSSQPQPQSLDNVKKCKNFLSTLLKLAASQPTETVKNVRQLIQGLIDGKVEPELFTERLQTELKSSPQPYLVPFLKKSLPLLRQSLIQNKMTIEGVRAPPVSVLQNHPNTSMGTMGLSNPIQTHQIIQASKAQLIQLQQRKGAPISSSNARQTLPKTVMAMAGSKSHPPSAVGAMGQQPKSHSGAAVHREKQKFDSLKDDDDINDVATMGGVNLSEESKNILASNADYIGTQIRSCKDEAFLYHGPLLAKMNAIAKKHGVDDISSEVVNLVSHATQERLRDLVEKLATIAEHRIEIYKMNDKFEVTKDVKAQLKFLEELDKIEKKRHEEQEWEKIMKAAKSRSKHEDPDQQKIKQRAKEMQQAEIERMRQEEANQTALAAIGPRKKRKTDFGEVSQGSSSGVNGFGSSSSRSASSRPRIKRVTLKDLLFLMEQERSITKSKLLYKTFLK